MKMTLKPDTMTTTETRNHEIASEILMQLGGRRFVAMTGSKNFTASENGLSMHLSNNKARARYLKITLNSLDLYDLKFSALDSKFNLVTKATRYNVYAEDLRAVFTEVTGLYTSL